MQGCAAEQDRTDDRDEQNSTNERDETLAKS